MHVRGKAARVGIIAGAELVATHVAVILTHDSLPFDFQCCVI